MFFGLWPQPNLIHTSVIYSLRLFWGPAVFPYIGPIVMYSDHRTCSMAMGRCDKTILSKSSSQNLSSRSPFDILTSSFWSIFKTKRSKTLLTRDSVTTKVNFQVNDNKVNVNTVNVKDNVNKVNVKANVNKAKSLSTGQYCGRE